MPRRLRRVRPLAVASIAVLLAWLAACGGGPAPDAPDGGSPGDTDGGARSDATVTDPDAGTDAAPSSPDADAGPDAAPAKLAPGCPAAHFCWENPLPQGEPLFAVHGTSPSDVWAVGGNGTILYWNGAKWSPIPSGTLFDLRGVFAASHDDVWITGDGGTLLHVVAGQIVPVDAGTTKDLTGVWGSAANDVWVVASSPGANTPDTGLFLHWDGSTWTSTPSDQAQLNGLWGSAANDVWVVGHPPKATDEDQVLRFDGHAWAKAATPQGFPYPTSDFGFWRGSGEPWLAAGSYTGSSVHRLDGGAWTEQFVRSQSLLAAVWGSADDDVWIAGSQTVHWNGASFADVPTGLETTQGWMRALWGTGRDDVWQVGDMGLLAHESAGAWTIASTGIASASVGGSALMGSGADDVWDVGILGVLHYDGHAWTRSDVGADDAGTPVSERIWVVSKSSAWLFGSDQARHWNGAAWSPSPAPPTFLHEPFEVWGSADDDLWIADGFTLQHWGGSAWTTIALPGGCGAAGPALAGSGASDVWLAGANGLQHVVGGWASPTCTLDASIKDVTSLRARAADDVWAVGAKGAIHHYDGHAWTTTPSGTTVDLTSVWASGPKDAWAVGGAPVLPLWTPNVVLHWDGATWSEVKGARGVSQVWGADASNVWLTGDEGRVLRFVP